MKHVHQGLTSFRCRQTACMAAGCQNVQLCSTILTVAFANEIIGPLYLFPLLYLIFQLGEGLLLFRIHDRVRITNSKYCYAPAFPWCFPVQPIYIYIYICLPIIASELLLSKDRTQLPFTSVTKPSALNRNQSVRFNSKCHFWWEREENTDSRSTATKRKHLNHF